MTTPSSFSLSSLSLSALSSANLRTAVRRLRRELPSAWGGGHSYDRRAFEAIRALRTWKPGDLVFDVGANDGRTIKRLHQFLPAPRIVALEPVSATFERLCAETRGLPRLQRLKLALGAEAGQRTIYLHASPALKSFDPAWRGHGPALGALACASGAGAETVQVETLDRLLQALGREHIHLLKIDVEGHDLEVLHGAQATLDQGGVDILMVEAGFDAPGRRQPPLEDFQSFLRPYGYFLYGVYNQCRAKLSARIGCERAPGADPNILIYCDAVFVRGG